MKGPTNPYQGQNLNTQVANTYSDALGVANNNLAIGAGALGAGAGYANAAGNAFSDAATGYNPQNITAGTLAGTDLQPYMNPFQKDVTDTTMNELWRQEQIGTNAAENSFQNANAFGGDRQAVYEAQNDRNFRDQRMSLLSQLNSANFLNAQNMATGDLNRKYNADAANQQMQGNMKQWGGTGLYNLGSGLGQMGQEMYSPDALGKLSQQGFNYYDQVAKNNLQAGTLQQQQMQSVIDAAKLQWQMFNQQPAQGLAAITGSANIPQSSVTKSNPGLMGILGGGAQILGSLWP
jgi:hypothetical protein